MGSLCEHVFQLDFELYNRLSIRERDLLLSKVKKTNADVSTCRSGTSSLSGEFRSESYVEE